MGFFKDLFKKKKIIEEPKRNIKNKTTGIILKNATKRDYLETDERDENIIALMEERRRAGRRKKAFGGVIFKEGFSTDEGGGHGSEIVLKIKEGKINKTVLRVIPDRTMSERFKIVEVIPKTKEAFVEIRSN